MRHLVLIKHFLPAIEPMLPAKQRPLSPEGHQRCSTLTTLLTYYTPTLIVSSPERKAQQTAAHLSLAFHQPYHVSEGLHEHERSSVGLLTQTRFEQTMGTFLPNLIVLSSAARAHIKPEHVLALLSTKHFERLQPHMALLSHSSSHIIQL